MVLDTSLLNAQQYKERIKGKLEQSKESNSALPYTSVLKPLKREPFGRPRLQSLTLLFIQVRHAGHCWRSRDELISDVLLWTPTHGRAKAGRPARTYIQQLCEDTGCCPEDLPEAMNDREKWRERVRDIRATSTTWRWWWWCIPNLH